MCLLFKDNQENHMITSGMSRSFKHVNNKVKFYIFHCRGVTAMLKQDDSCFSLFHHWYFVWCLWTR